MGVVGILGYGAVLDLLDSVVDRLKGHEKPLAWHNRVSKAIPDLDLEVCGNEDAVDHVLHLGPVDVEKLVRRHDFDIGHQECWLKPSPCDAIFDTRRCNADLVNQIAVLGDQRMIGFAPQHVDGTASLVAIGSLVGNQALSSSKPRSATLRRAERSGPGAAIESRSR